MIYLSSNLICSINTNRKQKDHKFCLPLSDSAALLTISFVEIILILKNIFIFNHPEFKFI